jgi:hypothetical protein
MHIPTFAAELLANLRVPAVTVVAGLLWTVDVAVSSVLAVRYVPPYTMKIRATGFEKRSACGRRKKVEREDLRALAIDWRPEAFSTIDLSNKASVRGKE